MAIPAAAIPMGPRKTVAPDMTNLVITETLFGAVYPKKIEDITANKEEVQTLTTLFTQTVEAMNSHVADYEAAIEASKGDPIDKKIRKAFLFALGFNNAAAKKPSDIGFNEALNAMKMQAENLKKDRLTLWRTLAQEINTPAPEIVKLRNASGIDVASAFLEWMNHHKDSLNTIQTLDLSRKRLTALPPEICFLTQLHELNLTDNNIQSLPENIGNLRNLRKFIFDGNNVQLLPPPICKLENLEVLSLKKCYLYELPDELSNLKELRILNLSINFFRSKLPPVVCKLYNLEVLDLSHSELHYLSDELSNLKKLRILNLSLNLLIDRFLPPICELENLEVLSLVKCNLRSLPDDIGKLKNLRMLKIRNNRLQRLPHSINEIENLKVTNRADSYPTNARYYCY